MAKVLVSMPDELLERIDVEAQRNGESRSGFLRRIATHELDVVAGRQREEVKRLMDLIRAEFHDDEPRFDAVRAIREDRESH